jgi:peptide deformylase
VKATSCLFVGSPTADGRKQMIQEIMKDEAFLTQRAEPAAVDDLGVAADLLETLEAHKDICVGMAANMIGVNKRIIAFDNGGTYMVMFNPKIIKKSEPYKTEEGCLSLTGIRTTKRWKSIKVQYQTAEFQTRYKTFTGWTAQIIQHEINHCEGILI